MDLSDMNDEKLVDYALALRSYKQRPGDFQRVAAVRKELLKRLARDKTTQES